MPNNLLKNPLMHFFVIGACLFGLYAWLNPDAMNADKQIVVAQTQIQNLTERFRQVWRREPSSREVQGLIEDFVLEEIYYREALSMGIDKDDPVIRRRLRQKMEIYTDTLTGVLSPSDAELNDYLHEHAEKFRLDSRYTFQQVFVSTDRSAKELERVVASIQQALAAGNMPKGDPSLLPTELDNASASAIDRSFGQGFATTLGEAPMNQWSAPLQSGLGVHFVRLQAFEPGGLPELASIRSTVEREWRYARQKALNESVKDRLLARYDVVIQQDEQAN